MPAIQDRHAPSPVYHIFGVPLRSGSYYPGNENDAPGLREAGLLARLQEVGCHAEDDGDVDIPTYLPHHKIPPIRSWPGPRIAWELAGAHIAPTLQQPGHVPLLIGCDCSIVVGTAQALRRASPDGVHVLYIDGDFDDAPPNAEQCQSAAAMATWLLTHGAPFRGGPGIDPANVTVIGWTKPAELPQSGMRGVSLADLRAAGAAETARRALDAIPPSASILVHFDIDVFSGREMPVAYFPHDEGLSLAEGAALLGVLLKDARIRVIEMTEYALLKDPDRQAATQLADLLAQALKSQKA